MFEPKVGDYVHIRNPRADQPSEGIVQGFCSDGKLKIGDKKPYVMRLPKNVKNLNLMSIIFLIYHVMPLLILGQWILIFKQNYIHYTYIL